MIRLRRVYDKAAAGEGTRFLVERLWPRGLRKQDLPPHTWQKEVAPSTELRQWFSHDPAKWTEFQRRYSSELRTKPESWKPILDAAKKGPVTLLYSSRDEEHNNAIALRGYLEKKL